MPGTGVAAKKERGRIGGSAATLLGWWDENDDGRGGRRGGGRKPTRTSIFVAVFALR